MGLRTKKLRINHDFFDCSDQIVEFGAGLPAALDATAPEEELDRVGHGKKSEYKEGNNDPCSNKLQRSIFVSSHSNRMTKFSQAN